METQGNSLGNSSNIKYTNSIVYHLQPNVSDATRSTKSFFPLNLSTGNKTPGQHL